MPYVSSSYTLKGKTVKNRIVFAPTRTFTYVTTEAVVNRRQLDHYRQIAQGGAGLMIVESCLVAKPDDPDTCALGIWSDEFIPGLSKIAEVCHQNEVVALAQIGHSGYRKDDGTYPPDPYSTTDLDELLDTFTAAATRVQKAGFDGVEIHGAHGFLISSLLSDKTNRRKDQYGGSSQNRARFAVSLIGRIRENLGDDFIIAIRFGYNETDSLRHAKMFEQAGADLLDVSLGVCQPEDLDHRELYKEGLSCVVYGAYNIKKAVSIPVISVYGISAGEQADLIVSRGYSDFAAVSRAILADPQWPSKIIRKEKITPCIHCPSCFWFSDCAKCPARKNRES